MDGAMLLKDIIKPDPVIELKSRDKWSALRELSIAIAEKNRLPAESIFNTMRDREKLGSTGIENGVAIPHGKIPGLKKFSLIVGYSKKGINFGAPDNKPAHIIFLLLSPEESTDEHLKVLAELCNILSSEKVKEALVNLRSPADLIEIILREESKLKERA